MNSRELIKRCQIEPWRSLIVCTSSRAEACRAPREIPVRARVNGQFFSLLPIGWLRSGLSSALWHLTMQHMAVWASGDESAPLKVEKIMLVQWRPLWVRLPPTGWFTWCRVALESHNMLWGKEDFGFQRAVISHTRQENSCFQLSRCEILPLSLCTKQRKPLSGLGFIPESPTTARALWKCDESTLKEVIHMVFGLFQQ